MHSFIGLWLSIAVISASIPSAPNHCGYVRSAPGIVRESADAVAFRQLPFDTAQSISYAPGLNIFFPLSSSCLFELLFNLAFHFIPAYRPVIIVVHSDVILSRQHVLQPQIVSSCRTASVYVPKQLPHSPIGASIAEERIMVEQHGLFAINVDAHLMRDGPEILGQRIPPVAKIMVAYDEDNLAIQP